MQEYTLDCDQYTV